MGGKACPSDHILSCGADHMKPVQMTAPGGSAQYDFGNLQAGLWPDIIIYVRST